jgi:hydroxyacylglutathione hydrolase
MNDMIKVISVVVGALDVNCYIVYDEKSMKALVIDPGGDPEKILQVLQKKNLELDGILLTHGHFDHIAAVDAIKSKTGASTAIHLKDAPLLTDIHRNLSFFMGIECIQQPPDILLEDGTQIKVGDYRGTILHSPGHTQGSICLLIETMIFSGDTLFQGSIGRTDLPGGNHGDLMDSIHEKLMKLPDDYTVFPGHGETTTIAREKENNPFLKKGRRNNPRPL